MKKNYSLLIALFVVGLSVFGMNVANALTASPAKLEISGDAGTTLTGIIELYNEKETSQTLFTSYENFESSDDSGAPRFVGGGEGLATWLNANDVITLGPKERSEIPYTISIPTDAEPGGYFAALFFGTQPPAAQGGEVSIGGRLGVLMLLRVNGDVPESAGILDFASLDEKKSFNKTPVTFSYRFSNTGGDRVVPKGTIELKNTFGVVRDTIDPNPTEGSVLPGTARRFTNTWEAGYDGNPKGFIANAKAQWSDFHFGWYTAQLNLSYGQKNQSADEKYSFMMFPWQLLIVVLGFIIVLWLIIKLIARSYKASIMKQMQAIQQQELDNSDQKKKTIVKKEKIVIEEKE